MRSKRRGQVDPHINNLNVVMEYLLQYLMLQWPYHAIRHQAVFPLTLVDVLPARAAAASKADGDVV